MRIIPAIDIINGQCVRLSKGDYNTKKIYNENPLEVAKYFEANGIEYLHLVDLDGAKNQHIVNYKILNIIASKTNLKIDFGGGIKSNEDIKIAFESGAKQVTGGSISIKNPEIFIEWIQKYGPDKIILGADSNNGYIAVQGWLEISEQPILEFINNYLKKGISYCICTDIMKDGMLEGPSASLYENIITHNETLKLIASGGISSVSDLYKLEEIGCEGAIIGKAFYENKISLKELDIFL